jgi:hypothetical protein
MTRVPSDYPLGAVARDVLWGLLGGVVLCVVVIGGVVAVQTLWRILPFLWRATW